MIRCSTRRVEIIRLTVSAPSCAMMSKASSNPAANNNWRSWPEMDAGPGPAPIVRKGTIFFQRRSGCMGSGLFGGPAGPQLRSTTHNEETVYDMLQITKKSGKEKSLKCNIIKYTTEGNT